MFFAQIFLLCEHFYSISWYGPSWYYDDNDDNDDDDDFDGDDEDDDDKDNDNDVSGSPTPHHSLFPNNPSQSTQVFFLNL